MAWYKTEEFEYVSHTNNEMVVRYLKDPNITAVITMNTTNYSFPPKRVAVYDGFLFMRSHHVHKLIELDTEKLRYMASALYYLKTGKKRYCKPD